MFKEPNQDKEQKGSSLAPNNVSRKLSARDMALGIGRKATDEELEEYLDRPAGKSVPLKAAVAKIKKKLSGKK
jgi:hypothetical protein